LFPHYLHLTLLVAPHLC